MRKRHYVILGLTLAYAVAGIVATPRLRHSWWYLQENVNRRFSTFCWLSAASAAFPWCIPDGLEAYGNMKSRGVPSKVNPDIFSMAMGTDPADALSIDARAMSSAQFKAHLQEFRSAHGGYRLWCYGRYGYCLTPPVKAEYGKVLDCFSDETKFAAFAGSRIYSPAALFACYVGDDAEVDPAFAGCPDYGALRRLLTAPRVLFRPTPHGALSPVSPARFTPFDVKFPAWLGRGNADAAVFLDFESQYEVVQEARREALIGFDRAAGGMSTNAIACWARAAKANPSDPLLVELGDALDFEARSYLDLGNVNGALRCYENRIEVFPKDVAAIHNFGVCLKRAGHPKLAAGVFARAVELDPLEDSHRMELIDCAETGGHPDIAVRQIDVLLKRHPDSLELKKRRARILVQTYLDGQKRREKGQEDRSPSRYMDNKAKGKTK